MNKMIQILIAVLIGQVCLVLILNTNFLESGQGAKETSIVTADLEKADSIVISQSAGDPLTLKKEKGVWVVPQVMNFPASPKSIEDIKKKFTEMKGGWPVATSKPAAKRFKVAKDDFEKKIAFSAGDKVLAEVFIGTSPNYRMRHVRSSENNKVFSASIKPSELSTKPKDWIDRTAYTYHTDKIKDVRTPEFTIVGKKDRWELNGIGPQEVTNQSSATNAVGTLAGIVFKSVEGDKPDPEFGLEEPEVKYTIGLKDGKNIEYRIGKRKINDGYILNTSDKKFFVSIDKYVVDNIKKLNRISMIAKKSTEEAIGKQKGNLKSDVSDKAAGK